MVHLHQLGWCFLKVFYAFCGGLWTLGAREVGVVAAQPLKFLSFSQVFSLFDSRFKGFLSGKTWENPWGPVKRVKNVFSEAATPKNSGKPKHISKATSLCRQSHHQSQCQWNDILHKRLWQPAREEIPTSRRSKPQRPGIPSAMESRPLCGFLSFFFFEGFLSWGVKLAVLAATALWKICPLSKGLTSIFCCAAAAFCFMFV